jgi:hypothetical protein
MVQHRVQPSVCMLFAVQERPRKGSRTSHAVVSCMPAMLRMLHQAIAPVELSAAACAVGALVTVVTAQGSPALTVSVCHSGTLSDPVALVCHSDTLCQTQ